MALPEARTCGNCGGAEGSASVAKLSACAGCGLVFYCSKACQKSDWKANHKEQHAMLEKVLLRRLFARTAGDPEKHAALKAMMRDMQTARLEGTLTNILRELQRRASSIVGEAVLREALTEVKAMVAAPLPPPPANSRFPTDCLVCPEHPPADLFDELKLRQKGTPAERDFQYWAGAVPPWRDGVGGAVTDPATLAPEEAFKLEVEEDDARHASTERLHARGVRVDWLLALTFALDLWEWDTKEVCGGRERKKAC